MRKAIVRAAKNPALLADAEKMKLDMVYRPPEHLERVVTQLYATPPALVEKAREDQPQSEVVITLSDRAAACRAAGSARRRRR